MTSGLGSLQRDHAKRDETPEFARIIPPIRLFANLLVSSRSSGSFGGNEYDEGLAKVSSDVVSRGRGGRLTRRRAVELIMGNSSSTGYLWRR